MPEKRDIYIALQRYKRWKGSIDCLIGGRRCFHILGRDRKRLLHAILESFSYHFLNCTLYRELCRAHRCTPGTIRQWWDIPRIPYILPSAFLPDNQTLNRRHLPPLSVAPNSIILYAPPFPPLDQLSKRRLEKIVKYMFAELGLRSPRRTNYICLLSDNPSEQVHQKFISGLIMKQTRINQIFHAYRQPDPKSFAPKIFTILTKLNSQGKPIRMLGPANLFSYLIDAGPVPAKLSLPDKSLLFLFEPLHTTQDDKANQKVKLSEFFSIKPSQIRYIRYLGHQGLPLCECEFELYHLPRIATAILRDERNQVLSDSNKPGRIQLITPFLNTMPALSTLTDMTGILNPSCPCGLTAPGILTVSHLTSPPKPSRSYESNHHDKRISVRPTALS